MDAEDRVAMGFGDKRLEWSVWCRIKEWTGDRDRGHILFQNRRAFFWPKFDKPNGLRLVPTAEGHLARNSGVAMTSNVCAKKLSDCMGGNPLRLYRQAMSRWG
jgi:hypothetical protein